uniref:TRIO and F-actin binding protein b n=1 Tax=Sinocyclocheilus anshuiensis TaxID=1608454 RepID=A0A671NKD5_9TELE
MQPDLLNFKKGWMSKLDESGEWRKHWFVLTDAGLKYYRDSAAEEVRITQNARHSSSLRLRSQSEATSTTANPAHRKFDYVELSPLATPSTPASTNQRESGEGQVREHSQWQEERPRADPHNQWEAVLSRKGAGQQSEQRRIEEEIERKWAEFERLPLKETRSLPPVGSRSSANQALEREVASLRQQLAEPGRGAESGCEAVLQQMERAHREALEELEKQHSQQISALERERDALLKEESDATARVMEALQKAHREELEKTTQLRETHGTDSHTLGKQQLVELASLRRELASLSERYSQKCVELKRAQQHSLDAERLVSQKDTQVEQLKRDNQDLQARLSEEVKVIRSLVTGQGSDGVTDGTERSWCETQVLLRVRENELQYLHKQLSSLRNQLLFLTTVTHLSLSLCVCNVCVHTLHTRNPVCGSYALADSMKQK